MGLAIVLGMSGFGTAWAQTSSNALLSDVSADDIVAIMQEEGYRAKGGVDNEGYPEIESSAQGVNFWVQFYNCTGEIKTPCSSISFATWLTPNETPTMEALNTFNAENRYVRAFLDSAGNTVLVMDIEAAGGVTPDNIGSWLGWWDTQLGEFLKHINWG